MRSPISYKAPSLLTIDTTTNSRQDDTNRGTLWTKSEVKWLIENYHKVASAQAAADFLRRSELSVRLKVHRLRRQQKMGGGLP